MQNRASCQRGRHIPRRHAIRSFRYAFASARDREASEEKRKKKRAGWQIGRRREVGKEVFLSEVYDVREREREKKREIERKRRKERCARYTHIHTHYRTQPSLSRCVACAGACKKKRRARNSRERKTRFKLAIRDKHWSTSLRLGRWRYLLTFRDQNGWAIRDNCVDVEKPENSVSF